MFGFVYLTNYALIPEVPQAVGPWLATGTALLLGITAWLIVETTIRGTRELLRHRR